MYSLDKMLQARSVAIVGASARPGSVGEQTLTQLTAGGFDGAIYPVNPGYESLGGFECYESITHIAQPVDLAILAVGNDKLEAETEKALSAGARSLTIFASCHGAASDAATLRERVTDLANDAGVPICGGNGMGFLNLGSRLRAVGFHQPETLRQGRITFLSHSGSLFSAMLHNRRQLGFDLVVSTGLELNVTMADYLNWALDHGDTGVVALFLETVRDPAGFLRALEKARSAEVPVVALKVGTSPRAVAAVTTHSAAIAGDDAVYEAVFGEYGVHRVETMDELIDTVELFASGRRASVGGLGAVHDSGGERAMLIDTCERLGVPLAHLESRTVDRLSDLLDPGLEPANPVDAWGTGRNAEDVFAGCLEALAGDDGVGVVAFNVDLTTESRPEDAYGAVAIQVAARTPKPVIVLANVKTTVDPAQAATLRTAGIPVLEGTETGLRAVGHLLRAGSSPSATTRHPRLTEPRSPARPKSDPFELLESYGITVPRMHTAASLDDTLAAARDLGFPVALKTAHAGHKTDVDGVRLDLRRSSDVELAYLDLATRLGPQVIVATQVPRGVEVALGMVDDQQFGPILLVAAGGTLVELLDDRVALIPPVDQSRASRAIDRLRMRPLLSGHRGLPAANLDALADVIVRFSELAHDQRGQFSSIDVNPVIVGASATAVDVLAVSR